MTEVGEAGDVGPATGGRGACWRTPPPTPTPSGPTPGPRTTRPSPGSCGSRGEVVGSAPGDLDRDAAQRRGRPATPGSCSPTPGATSPAGGSTTPCGATGRPKARFGHWWAAPTSPSRSAWPSAHGPSRCLPAGGRLAGPRPGGDPARPSRRLGPGPGGRRSSTATSPPAWPPSWPGTCATPSGSWPRPSATRAPRRAWRRWRRFAAGRGPGPGRQPAGRSAWRAAYEAFEELGQPWLAQLCQVALETRCSTPEQRRPAGGGPADRVGRRLAAVLRAGVAAAASRATRRRRWPTAATVFRAGGARVLEAWASALEALALAAEGDAGRPRRRPGRRAPGPRHRRPGGGGRGLPGAGPDRPRPAGQPRGAGHRHRPGVRPASVAPGAGAGADEAGRAGRRWSCAASAPSPWRCEGEPLDLHGVKPRARSLLRLLVIHHGRLRALGGAGGGAVAGGVAGGRQALAAGGGVGDPPPARAGDVARLVVPHPGRRRLLPHPARRRPASTSSSSRPSPTGPGSPRPWATTTPPGRSPPRRPGPLPGRSAGGGRPGRVGGQGPGPPPGDRRRPGRAPGAEPPGGSGSLAAAVQTCQRGLEIDRYRDGLWRLLVAAYRDSGDQATAGRAGGLRLRPPRARRGGGAGRLTIAARR